MTAVVHPRTPTRVPGRGSPGQAAAELAALVALVALASLAVAHWLPRSADLPRRAPLEFGRVLPGPAAVRVHPIRRTLVHPLPRSAHPDELRRWYAGAPTAVRTGLLGAVAASALVEVLAEEARAAIRDPVRWGRERGGPPGPGEVGALLRGVRTLPDWVRHVRGLGYRRGSERVAHDLGRLAGRGLVEWFTRRRAIAGALRRLPWPAPPRPRTDG